MTSNETEIILKHCSKCHEDKPLDQYYKSNAFNGVRGPCKGCLSKKYKAYRNIHKERLNADKRPKSLAYHRLHKEKLNAKLREYNRNRPKIEKQKAYAKQKLTNRHGLMWRRVLRSTLMRMGRGKSSSTMELLGYSAKEFKIHIESLFQPGMTWDNYGPTTWHIDHIKELHTFAPDTDVSIVNALSNLRPLWAHQNYERNKKHIKEMEEIF